MLYLTSRGAAVDAELDKALVSAAVGVHTPQDRIRRAFSAPIFDSREKGSMPSKAKRPPHKKKVKKGHAKPRKPNVPSAAGPSHAEGLVPSHEELVAPSGSVSPEAGPTDETQLAPDASSGLDPHHDGDTAKATAAKSMPKKPLGETTCEAVPVPTTKTEVTTPAPSKVLHGKKEEPSSVVRDRAVENARVDNLARAVTRELDDSNKKAPPAAAPAASPAVGPASPAMSELPSPSSPGAAPSEVPSSLAPSSAPTSTPATTGDTAGGTANKVPEEVERDARGRKKRRPKTAQEKANHARFVRFTRQIQST